MAKSYRSLEEELVLVREELCFEKEEKKKILEELILARNELSFQKDERGKRADEKEKRAAELIAQQLGISQLEAGLLPAQQIGGAIALLQDLAYR